MKLEVGKKYEDTTINAIGIDIEVLWKDEDNCYILKIEGLQEDEVYI